MFPSNKRVTMETNFQNSKNWPFSNLNNFFTAKLYKNDIYSVYTTHVWFINAMNKKPQNVYNFCFHGNETDRQKFYRNTPISKRIILLMQTEIWIM